MMVQGPLYTVTGAAGRGGQQQQVPPAKAPPGQLSTHQVLFDAAGLIQQEFRRLLDRFVRSTCGVMRRRESGPGRERVLKRHAELCPRL